MSAPVAEVSAVRPEDSQERARAHVAALKASGLDTRELTRAVAGFLFSECGEIPTANLIYSLTRQGSMTTVNNELKRFWADIRGRTGVRITNESVPQAVLELFSEVAGKVWEQASARARDSAEASVALARSAIEAERADLNARDREREGRLSALETELAARTADFQGSILVADGLRAREASLEAELESLRVELARGQERTAQLELRARNDAASWQLRYDEAREAARRFESEAAERERSAAAHLRSLMQELDRARQAEKSALVRERALRQQLERQAEASTKLAAEFARKSSQLSDSVDRLTMEVERFKKRAKTPAKSGARARKARASGEGRQ